MCHIFTEMLMHGYFNLNREKANKLTYGHTRRNTSSTDVHFHSQIEVYLVRSGLVEVLINDKRRLLRGGEIAVSLSYDAHGYRTVGEADTMYLIIPTDIFSDFSSLLAHKRLGEPFIDDTETYTKVLSAMEELMVSKNELSARGYVYIILGAILDLERLEQRDEPMDARFGAEMLIYIGKHFREELTLTDVATEFGYNPSYLSRYFKDTFGISFGKYLSTPRLREAVLLLKGGERNITECALESGFGSVRSFYRVFYEEFKCTPKEYLKNERMLFF